MTTQNKPRHYKRPLLVSLLPGLITDQAMSCEEIAKALARNATAVRVLMAKLYNDIDKKVYVAGWRRTAGQHTALYRWGNLPDAPRIPWLTAAEACKRYRETPHGKIVHKKLSRRWYRKNDGRGVKQKARANQRALDAFNREGVAAIDPLLAAVMGVMK